jgi:Trypsin
MLKKSIILLTIITIIESRAQDCGLQKAYTVQTVINGDAAAPGQFPWTVSLFNGSDYKCGGTILDKTHILTGL